MLYQLKRYAQDHEIAVKYGFKSDTCRWLIDVNGKGDFLSLSRIDGEFPLCPKYPSNLMNAGGRTHFLLEAFYCLKASQNAAMSEEAVLIYTAALNRMIKDAPRPLGNVLILHGYDKYVPPDADLIASFADMDSFTDEAERMEAEDRFHGVIESVTNGKRPNYNSNRYYVFSLSGASGRVIIRDYIEDDCVNLAKNFSAWFDDIAIVSPKGGQDAKSPKLVGLLTRLISYREKDSKVFQRVADELSPIVPSIWRSILTRTPIPDAVAQKAYPSGCIRAARL